jgi:hypothetical protein
MTLDTLLEIRNYNLEIIYNVIISSLLILFTFSRIAYNLCLGCVKLAYFYL